MKNYLRVLETSKKDRLHKTISSGNHDGRFTQWKAIRTTEQMADAMLKRLNDILPTELVAKVQNVKLDMMEEAGARVTVFVKAQLFATEHRELLLKVFLHQENNKGKTKKIAKAVYQLELENTESSQVA